MGNPVGTDGKAAVETDGADMRGMTAVVVRGGVLRNRKSIALPSREIPTPTLTAEDLENLRDVNLIDESV